MPDDWMTPPEPQTVFAVGRIDYDLRVGLP